MKMLKKIYFKESPDNLVTIYRAQPAFTNIIRTNDYITLSHKFAENHAVTSAVYNEESFFVVMKTVPRDKIKEADNPGEYKWQGEDLKAIPIQIADENGEIKKVSREIQRTRKESNNLQEANYPFIAQEKLRNAVSSAAWNDVPKETVLQIVEEEYQKTEKLKRITDKELTFGEENKNLQEIDKQEAKNYFEEIKIKDQELFKQLQKLAQTIIRMKKMEKTPNEVVNIINMWFKKNPDLNPLKSGDTQGIKMFIDNFVENPKEAGNTKKFYDNILNALLKSRYSK